MAAASCQVFLERPKQERKVMDFGVAAPTSGYTSDLEEALRRQGGGAGGIPVIPPPRPAVDVEEIEARERRRLFSAYAGLDAYSMHKKFVNDYVRA